MSNSGNCLCGRTLTSKEISEGISYVEWKGQGILNMSELRGREKTVVGDTDLCQQYYLILKDMQLPKTSPRKSVSEYKHLKGRKFQGFDSNQEALMFWFTEGLKKMHIKDVCLKSYCALMERIFFSILICIKASDSCRDGVCKCWKEYICITTFWRLGGSAGERTATYICVYSFFWDALSSLQGNNNIVINNNNNKD